MQPFNPPSSSTSRPATPDSPSFEKESHMGSRVQLEEARKASDDAVKEFAGKRDGLGQAIEASQAVVANIRSFGEETLDLRYPRLQTPQTADEPGHGSSRPVPQRTSTSAAESNVPGTTIPQPSRSQRNPLLKRSLTTYQGSGVNASSPSGRSDSDDRFSIFSLEDLSGNPRHALRMLADLESSTTARLLNNRLDGALTHLGALLRRVHDPQSRMLITGDLNAGKSTFANALLRSNTMPTDQQPLTTRFVEVVSAKENGDVEEIHVLSSEKPYDVDDKTTYTVEPIERLEDLATDENADSSSPPLRVFLRNSDSSAATSTILHNGVVDISLIDAPGLNRDSIKTTANFARQEEIDVIVFVVSAANHFTLSAKEFLWQASMEKAHLFIVVNRYDQIKDKERCRRLVLEQIKQLSPQTYADAADLVHFVDSAKVAMDAADDVADDLDQAFAHLEHSLRSFVLVNRSRSKLGPAQNYLTHLLVELESLTAFNKLSQTEDRDEAIDEMNRVKPVLEQMEKSRDSLDLSLASVVEDIPTEAGSRARSALERGLERVGRGELAAPAPGVEMPVYPGVFGALDYAQEVRKALLSSLDFVVKLAENDTRNVTADGVSKVIEIGEKHLPANVERSKRVFNPDAMFAHRSSRSDKVASLGLSLARSPSLNEVRLSDFFDLHHHIFLARSSLSSQAPSTSKELVPMTDLTGLGAASLAVGAMTIGGKALGLQSMIEGVVRISDVLANPSTRQWIGPALGVVTLGAVAYVIYDLPQSIPRNVGRSIRNHLVVSSGLTGDIEIIPFAELHSGRVRKESAKVMNIVAIDKRSLFRMAIQENKDLLRQGVEKKTKAESALAMWGLSEKQIAAIKSGLEIK